jgi:hypothetical protein
MLFDIPGACEASGMLAAKTPALPGDPEIGQADRRHNIARIDAEIQRERRPMVGSRTDA